MDKDVTEAIFGKKETCLVCEKTFRIKEGSILDRIKKENNEKPLCFKCFAYHSEW